MNFLDQNSAPAISGNLANYTFRAAVLFEPLHEVLKAELGRLCPFSAPRGHTFSTCPLGSPQGYFMGKFSPLTSIKFLPPMPPIKK